jgi:site-specific DNA recombinase
MNAIQPQGIPAVPHKYYLYARKSSEAEDRQVASIDAQVAELQKVAWENNLSIIEIFTESQSAKAPGRPVFNQMLQRIKSGEAEGIICWKLDRLARNPIDGGQISWMLQKNIIKQIQTFGRVYYPTDNVLMMQVELGMANQFIIDLSVNVKRGLRAKCASGWRPGMPPLGYHYDPNCKKGEKKIIIDPERAPIMKQMFVKVAYQGCSGRDILEWLNEIGFKTRTDHKMALSRIYTILRDHFYYGRFEYPVGSGTFYDGRHEPIIDKDLFDKVQACLVVVPRLRAGSKEFHFTKLMKCGGCGSGLTATEKFKRISDGRVNKYIYYHCMRYLDRYCNEQYIREEELIGQLVGMMDTVSIDQIGAKEKLEREIERHKRFMGDILNKETEASSEQVNIRSYAKYILKEGSRDEKREILCNLKSRIILMGGKISIEKSKSEVASS